MTVVAQFCSSSVQAHAMVKEKKMKWNWAWCRVIQTSGEEAGGLQVQD